MILFDPISTCEDETLRYELVPCKVKLPDTNKLPPMNVFDDTFNEPVIEVSLLTCRPSAVTEAVTAPLAILSNCKPVTPDAGMLYKPAPSPLNEPLMIPEPVMLPVTTKPVPLYVNPL